MSDWSWKQALAESIIRLVNEKASPNFSIDEIYAQVPEFSALFPRNQHVKEKLRQILQRLRNDGLLSFVGGGNYQLNVDFEDLEGDPAPPSQVGVESPQTRRVLRNIRLRCTLLVVELKKRYRGICQVCRKPVVLTAKHFYAEGHHLRPLGAPHLGPDVPSNIIVLCPNHHVMFDRGVATIIPGSLMLRHRVNGVFPKGARLHLEPWHELSPKLIEYHHYNVFEAA